jgi:hypothetical protein
MSVCNIKRETGEERAARKIKDKNFIDTWRQDNMDNKYYLSVPDHYQKLFIESLLGMLSPMKAIKAKCLECICYQPGFIDDCGGHNNCPLYKHRPFQKKAKTGTDKRQNDDGIA